MYEISLKTITALSLVSAIYYSITDGKDEDKQGKASRKITISSAPPKRCHFKLLDVERLALPLPSDLRSEQVVMVFVRCHLEFSSNGIPFSNKHQTQLQQTPAPQTTG